MPHVNTQETRQMWTTTFGELREFMEQRAQLLIWQPLTKHEHLKTVRLPHSIEDEYGAPPVVVWLGPLVVQKEKAGGNTNEPDWGQHSVRQRWASDNQGSWSCQRWQW